MSGLPKPLMRVLMENHGKNTDDTVTIYTGAKLIDDEYLVWQEVDDVLVMNDAYGMYSIADMPFSAVRWSTAPGRDAGIGLTELCAGDWHTFHVLAETDVDLLALMTDILTLVDTSAGNIKINDVLSAESGGYIPGGKDALTSHAHNLAGKLQDVDYKTQQVLRRLSQMYLLTGNVIRDSERTTAEEVRITTQEIGQVHQAPYVNMGNSLQKPIAHNLLKTELPDLGDIKPQVMTGVTDMTRMAELDAQRGVWNDLVTLGQIPQHIAVTLKIENIVANIAAGWGVDYSQTIRTQKEIEAEQQRQAELNQQQPSQPM